MSQCGYSMHKWMEVMVDINLMHTSCQILISKSIFFFQLELLDQGHCDISDAFESVYGKAISEVIKLPELPIMTGQRVHSFILVVFN